MNKINTYKITRFFLFPLIIIADYLQTNCTKNFTPMNMGPVADPIWRKTILKHLSKKNFVIDYGCGVGFFCRLFDSKKYIGLEVNKNFIERAKKINKNYNFFEVNDKKIIIYKKKINAIFINNVLHHMSDNQVSKALKFLKKNSRKSTKVLIIEPLFPENFFSLQFFLKALDIGDFIRTKKHYLKIIEKEVRVKGSYAKKFGIGTAIIFHGYLKK